MGEFAVGRAGDVLAALGLGSCVAMVVSDAEASIAALAHVLLPSQSLSRRGDYPGRSPDTALPLVVAALEEAGAEPTHLRARLVGGAAMFADLLPGGTMHMGERNVAACRAALRAAEIPIIGEMVGGRRGRSVWLDVDAGTVTACVVHGEPEIV